ncbi:MAG: hypothetical protein PHI66_01960 [Candidatus Pacebacteria bacterium]|nr:hypothetical protein [Candidatus Paceibacterota bacterium]
MKIKKISAMALILSISFTAFSPVLATAETTGAVSTSLTRDEGSGENPIVKAKWEANVDKYTDDSTAAGAQFNPTGVYQSNKTIAICAIVTDPDGLSDINKVYADVYYPTGIAVGEHHVKLSDQDGSAGAGCGLLMQEDSLSRLSKSDGYTLFCNNVRNQNNNLPTFNTGYDYDEICAADGELMKETAAVYCTEKDLSYEDPSGDYRTLILAQDNYGKDGVLDNYFEYLPMTAFETDFSAVNYGTVKLNTHKIINGDLTWDAMNQGKASVRNVGNTRLYMKVWQDDMGLGKTDGNWNVRYDGRVGSDASFVNYNPEVTRQLNNALDLSEMNEMDFSIDIFKFPPEHGGNSYTGNMTLSATKTGHLTCNTAP